MTDTAATTPYDLRLTGGQVMLPGRGLSQVDVCVRDGRVAAIVARADPAAADEVVDLTGRVILPGAIDAHVHLGKNIAAPEEPIDAHSVQPYYTLLLAEEAGMKISIHATAEDIVFSAE